MRSGTSFLVTALVLILPNWTFVTNGDPKINTNVTVIDPELADDKENETSTSIRSSKRQVGKAQNWLRRREERIHHNPNSTLAQDQWHVQVPWGIRTRETAMRLLPDMPVIPPIPHIKDPKPIKEFAEWFRKATKNRITRKAENSDLDGDAGEEREETDTSPSNGQESSSVNLNS